MRGQVFRADSLVNALRELKIATMVDLKSALGTDVDMTVFRKLRELSYCSSYSHRGMYYALVDVAGFDERGLWTYRDVHFSRFGSLIETAERFVDRSPLGYLASELSVELSVRTKETLLKLVRDKRLVREGIAGQFVYCSVDSEKRRLQLLGRRLPFQAGRLVVPWDSSAESPEEVRAALILFYSFLNEKQRRLYAGLESLRLGKGGDRLIASLVGMDTHTVARGRKELLHGTAGDSRIRRPGGGRRHAQGVVVQ